MLTPEDNDLLCRVEGDAAMGKIMRAHWMPALMSEEIAKPDGTPVKIRLLGEDLVAFRDSDGRVGILDEHCPHRRASLVYGRNEECGLRCRYHGWKFNVDGQCVEMASEPRETGLCEKVQTKSYPAQEAGGFVWVYMGDKRGMPAFEPPAFAPSSTTKVSILKIQVACNWAQVLEGQIDSAHSSSLHASDMRPAKVDSAKATNQAWLRPSTDKAPRLQMQRTDYGFRYAAIRRPITNAATHEYVRVTVYVAPFLSLIPPNNAYNVASLNIPMDDANTYFYFIAWSDSGGIDQEAWRKFNAAQVGIDVDQHFRPFRTAANRYQQDRQAMAIGDTTGIRGIPTQDIAMWESMGAIADRSKDRLGASDLAVVEFRQMMVEAAKRVQNGGPVIGRTGARTPHIQIRSSEGIMPKSVNWRDLGAGAPY